MYTRVALSTLAAAALFAAPASAKCADDLAAVTATAAKDKILLRAFGRPGETRKSYRTLIRAARVFDRHDMDARCRDVVEGIRELASKTSKMEQEREKAAAKNADNKMTEKQKRLAFLKAARPATEASISLERLTGADVRNFRDEDLGDVDDVILRANGKHTAIVGRGGVIGIGDIHYAVPFDKLRIRHATKSYDLVVVWNVSGRELEAMPRVKQKDGVWVFAADGSSVEDGRRHRDKNK